MDFSIILRDPSFSASSSLSFVPFQRTQPFFNHTISQDLTGSTEELEWKVLSAISSRWHNISGISLAHRSSNWRQGKGKPFPRESSGIVRRYLDSSDPTPAPQSDPAILNSPRIHTQYLHPHQNSPPSGALVHFKPPVQVNYLFSDPLQASTQAAFGKNLHIMDLTVEGPSRPVVPDTCDLEEPPKVPDTVAECPSKTTDMTEPVDSRTESISSKYSTKSACNIENHTRLSELINAYTQALGDEIESMEERIEKLRDIHYLHLQTIEKSPTAPDSLPFFMPDLGFETQRSRSTRTKPTFSFDWGSSELRKAESAWPVEVKEEVEEEAEEEAEPITPDPASIGPRIHIVHRVICKGNCVPRRSVWTNKSELSFFDQPQLYAGDDEMQHLRGKNRFVLDSFIAEHPEVPVIVYKDYDCVAYCNALQDDFRLEIQKSFSHSTSTRFRLCKDGPKAVSHNESLSIVSDILLDALLEAIDATESISKTPKIAKDFSSPYLFFYHYMDKLRRIMLELESPAIQLLEILLDHIESTHAADFSAAQAMTAENMVSPVHLSKLYRPGDLVLVKGLDGASDEVRGFIVETWPQAILDADETHTSFYINCWSWEFDGEFHVESRALTVSLPKEAQSQPINSLSVVPEKYYSSDSLAIIKFRGQKFWECRKQNYITYSGWDHNKNQNYVDTRFMIDLQTYRKMHPEAPMFTKAARRDDLGEAKMAADKPPDDIFLHLLPPTIFGFNMMEKTWVNLNVSQMLPIVWNKQAFNRLVLKQEKKDLIKALVIIQIAGNKSTDYISGKGNGLIVLLHGGPGTGKTLTAESVAELAEKPLYRVTCGDIGTSPEEVEKYLESILYIGKTWGCVVLLDEADVFLEERSLSDLQRNGLVSVFLRVLEYYDGIFILTSNRVGSFDEAFKSRIQLALHYPKLGEQDRRKIWRNFTRMLKDIKIDIDIDDLDDKIDDLAKHNMNGREIRNAVTTARQLAQFKKEKLNYSHLELVINTAKEFNQYLADTRGHTDDEYARGAQLRQS